MSSALVATLPESGPIRQILLQLSVLFKAYTRIGGKVLRQQNRERDVEMYRT